MAIKTQTLNGPDLYGYLAEPETGARGGVLIYPTIFAVNDFVRGYAETLARAGLAAAVWDIYSGLPLVTDYQESLKRARMLDDAGVADMTGKWIDHMFGAMGLASVGVLGFCIGGRYALLQAAADKRLKACAMAYPSIENPRLANQDQDALTLAADIACPVHLLHAGKDHVTEPPTYQLRNARKKYHYQQSRFKEQHLLCNLFEGMGNQHLGYFFGEVGVLLVSFVNPLFQGTCPFLKWVRPVFPLHLKPVAISASSSTR